ncbi:hypothetical protein GCM10010387_65640 [Streptomyces inusitatus]|uniref:Uncharacterized protein n=1 Tax=Streptomyces inusitatus TaxID=68221 RepID=A0A918QNZ5_9ACTN|nr:hypothetical protein [Streptomyces inusitatus]GGZ63109.1 hypothetical protein GCM10010387_65640 [Streptomyces inusitatus]
MANQAIKIRTITGPTLVRNQPDAHSRWSAHRSFCTTSRQRTCWQLPALPRAEQPRYGASDCRPGLRAAGDIEHRPDRASPYRARVRWFDPAPKRRRSLSEGKDTHDEAEDWISGILKAAEAGITPNVATMSLTEYSTTTMNLALRGLEPKTPDPYLAGWHRRVAPALGHFPVRMITNGAVDRTVHLNPAPGRRRQTAWSPTGPQERRKGGTGLLRYRLRPAKTLVGTTGFEPATP